MAGPEAIYLDHHATTPVDPRVAKVLYETLLSTFGNPNSAEHVFGSAARVVVERARAEVAALVGAPAAGVTFTSGATEAIRLAIQHSVSTTGRGDPLRVLASPLEHRAVLDALADVEREGVARVRYFQVDRAGRIDFDSIRSQATEGVDLLCAMAANNEIGTVYPVDQITRFAIEHGASTLIDATQAAGRVPLNVEEWGITYLTISAHKMYGPKGVGALVLGSGSGRKGGGAHGTPNVPGISAMGEACRLRRLEMGTDEPRIRGLRDRMQRLLRLAIPDLVVNGDPIRRLSGSLHVSVPGVPNGAVVARLADRLAISTGSACTSGADAPSHVLVALGLEDDLVDSALRISLGKFNSDAEITNAAALIIEAVDQVRTAMKGVTV